jgi:hypothetical protein
MTIMLSTQKGTKINIRKEPVWKHQVVLSEFTDRKAENGKSTKTETLMTFPYHPHLHHPVRLEVGVKGSPEVDKEKEGAEEAITS